MISSFHLVWGLCSASTLLSWSKGLCSHPAVAAPHFPIPTQLTLQPHSPVWHQERWAVLCKASVLWRRFQRSSPIVISKRSPGSDTAVECCHRETSTHPCSCIPATRKHPHIPAAAFLVNQLIKMVVRRWETTSKTVSKSHSVQIDFQTSDTTGLPLPRCYKSCPASRDSQLQNVKFVSEVSNLIHKSRLSHRPPNCCI